MRIMHARHVWWVQTFGQNEQSGRDGKDDETEVEGMGDGVGAGAGGWSYRRPERMRGPEELHVLG